MEDILVLIVQGLVFFAEALLEIAAYWPVDWPFNKISDRYMPHPESLFTACFSLLVLGGLVGYVSLKIFPYTLLQFSWLRMGNVIVAPLGSGLLAWIRVRRNPEKKASYRFWWAFFFTLGLALIRFAFAIRYVRIP